MLTRYSSARHDHSNFDVMPSFSADDRHAENA